MYIYEGIEEPMELRALLNGKECSMSWNINSPRLTVLKEA